MKTPHSRHSVSGFTILEMLVGLVIFVIAITGFSGMMILMTQGTRQARKIDEAATLVQSTVETMSAVEWNSLGTDTAFPAENGFNNALVRTNGPLDRNGYGSSNTLSNPPYLYYQSVVICTDAHVSVVAGTSPTYCSTALGGNNRPQELACDTLGLTAREKMIRVLVSWTERSGACKFKSIDSLSFQ